MMLSRARHPAEKKTPVEWQWIYHERVGTKIRPGDLRHAFALQYLRNGGHTLALRTTLRHALSAPLERLR